MNKYQEALNILYANVDYIDYSKQTLNKANQAFEVLEDGIDRLEKLEKIIEILKRVCIFQFEKETTYPQDEWADCYVIYISQFNNGFNKEEYELLKEVLEDE